MSKKIPRWQQGFRPHAYGDVWDKMSPKERRRAFIGDIILCAFCILIIYILFSGILWEGAAQ